MNDVCYIDEQCEMKPVRFIKDLSGDCIYDLRGIHADPDTVFKAIVNTGGYGRMYELYSGMFGIKKVIFHDPATIVFWNDGTKTVVKCSKDDKYSKEVGLAFCIMKKLYGNEYIFHQILKKWCTEENKSVNPQERIGHCKDCKYFEYDSVAKVDGIPLIVAHEICNKWGDGCKTKEDGYCFLFEPRENVEDEDENV